MSDSKTESRGFRQNGGMADGRKLFPIKNTTEEITKAITEDSAGEGNEGGRNGTALLKTVLYIFHRQINAG